FFGFVEKTIEADGREMVRARAEGAETEGNVVAGFAHGAVAAIIFGIQRDGADLRAVGPVSGDGSPIADIRGGKRADGFSGLVAGSLHDEEVAADVGMREEIRSDLAMDARFVFQTFRRGTFAEIVVARETRVSREVRIANPVFVIAGGVCVCFFEP